MKIWWEDDGEWESGKPVRFTGASVWSACTKALQFLRQYGRNARAMKIEAVVGGTDPPPEMSWLNEEKQN